MRITICGSIAYQQEMNVLKNSLEQQGHEVKIPLNEIKGEDGKNMRSEEFYTLRKSKDDHDDWVWDRKEDAMRQHFKKVEWCDAVLIVNHDLYSIPGYIGANTLLEMGLAFHLEKPIFLMNKIPDLPCKEEIIGMKPVLLNGDLSKLGAGEPESVILE